MNSAPRAFFVAVSLLVIPVAILPISCGGQGEGQRCEHQNGDADCASGLVCKQGAELHGNADICCPEGDSQNPECNDGGSTGTETTSTTTSDTTTTTTTTTTTSTGSSSSTASGSTSSSSSSSSSASTGGGGGGGGAGGAGG